MTEVTQALYTTLTGDGTLAGLLAKYPAQSTTPAVFTKRPVPADAVMPYVVAEGELADEPFDSKTRQGREVFRDIGCFTAAREDDGDKVDQIAARVRALLHRVPVAVAGFGTLLTSVSGPVVAPTGDGVCGRILTVRLMLTPP